MNITLDHRLEARPGKGKNIASTVTRSDVERIIERYGYSPEAREIIVSENLLPPGVLSRLQATYPQHSGLLENRKFFFHDRENYSGLDGFREVINVLKKTASNSATFPNANCSWRFIASKRRATFSIPSTGTITKTTRCISSFFRSRK